MVSGMDIIRCIQKGIILSCHASIIGKKTFLFLYDIGKDHLQVVRGSYNGKDYQCSNTRTLDIHLTI